MPYKICRYVASSSKGRSPVNSGFPVNSLQHRVYPEELVTIGIWRSGHSFEPWSPLM